MSEHAVRGCVSSFLHRQSPTGLRTRPNPFTSTLLMMSRFASGPTLRKQGVCVKKISIQKALLVSRYRHLWVHQSLFQLWRTNPSLQIVVSFSMDKYIGYIWGAFAGTSFSRQFILGSQRCSVLRDVTFAQVTQDCGEYTRHLILLLQSFVNCTERLGVFISFTLVSDSLQLHGLQPASHLCPWNSPGKDTGVGCHSPLFLTQGSNLGLLHCRQVISRPSHQGSPFVPEDSTFPVLCLSQVHSSEIQGYQYHCLGLFQDLDPVAYFGVLSRFPRFMQ